MNLLHIQNTKVLNQTTSVEHNRNGRVTDDTVLSNAQALFKRMSIVWTRVFYPFLVARFDTIGSIRREVR